MKFISAVALATLGTATAAIAMPPNAGTTNTQTSAQAAVSDTTSAKTKAAAKADTHKATPKIGDAVFDKAGEAVGTIEAVTETSFVLATADGRATMEIGALSHGPKGHMIALTKAELDQAIHSAAAPG